MPRQGSCLMFFVQQHKHIKLDEDDLHTYGIYTANFDGDGYVRITFGGKKVYLHRLIMGLPERQVDHKNGDKADNRKDNLRLATNQQNMANTPPRVNNASGFKGVAWFKLKKKWQACIQLNGRTQHLGYYKEAKNAALAYDRKARELFGEFAYLNFPEET